MSSIRYRTLDIERFKHATFMVRGSKTIYIDVYKIVGVKHKADIVLSTHEHFDHLSVEDIKQVLKDDTVGVTCQQGEKEFRSMWLRNVIIMKPFEKRDVEGIKIETIPAYNTNKFREPGKPFHPRFDNKVGFVVEIDSVRIYHAGDTDAIPEMKQLKDINVALLPVSGTYVMTWEEALEAVKMIRPEVAIPMHYGTVVGNKEDAVKFREKASKLCRVEII